MPSSQIASTSSRDKTGASQSSTACPGSWRPCLWPTRRAGFCRRGMFCPTHPSRSPAFRRRIGRTLSGSWAGTVLSFPTISAHPFSIRWSVAALRPFNVMGRVPEAHFDSNLMERLIQTWSRDLTAKKTCLSPRSFLAVLRQNPGVDTGVGLTTEQAGYHLLLGYY